MPKFGLPDVHIDFFVLGLPVSVECVELRFGKNFYICVKQRYWSKITNYVFASFFID